jgi:hypothetical protein
VPKGEGHAECASGRACSARRTIWTAATPSLTADDGKRGADARCRHRPQHRFFSLVHAILLRTPPYPDAHRLVWVAPVDPHFSRDTWASRADYLIWKQQTDVFDAMTAYGTQDLALETGSEATQERVASVGGDFWAITGATPHLGRLVGEADEQSLVLSYQLFERRFGARSSAIGEIVMLSGHPFTVSGVLPKGFRAIFPQQLGPGDDRRDLDAFRLAGRSREARHPDTFDRAACTSVGIRSGAVATRRDARACGCGDGSRSCAAAA